MTSDYLKNKDTNPETPKCIILMGAFNGEKYISEQLESIEKQTYSNWELIVSDDGSSDQTRRILDAFKNKWPSGKLTIVDGPKLGFSANFLTLISDPKIKGDYFAFCDQDDIWLHDKIQRAIHVLEELKASNKPLMYCGRRTFVNEALEVLAYSRYFHFPFIFRNALAQNIAPGNTMVIDAKVKKILEITNVPDLPFHDWWVYLIVTGVGGEVFFDNESKILYRQHSGALVGGNDSIAQKLQRFKKLLDGNFIDWKNRNIKALQQYSFLLNSQAKYELDIYAKTLSSSFFQRLKYLMRSRIFRQSVLDTIAIYLTILLKRP